MGFLKNARQWLKNLTKLPQGYYEVYDLKTRKFVIVNFQRLQLKPIPARPRGIDIRV